MNFGQILQQTGALDRMASELGIDNGTASKGAAALLPAILAGVGRSSAGSGESSGLGGLIAMISGLGGGGLLDAVTGQTPTPVEKGNDILGNIFGNKDVSRTVAEEAAHSSGVSQDLLKKMLPILAMVVTGYLAKQARAQSGADSAEPRRDGGLGGLLGSILGGFGGR